MSVLDQPEKQWGTGWVGGGSNSQNASDTCSQTQAIYLWGKEPKELLSRRGGNKQKQTVCGIERAKNEQSTCTHNKKKMITWTLHALYRLTDNGERRIYCKGTYIYKEIPETGRDAWWDICISHACSRVTWEKILNELNTENRNTSCRCGDLILWHT